MARFEAFEWATSGKSALREVVVRSSTGAIPRGFVRIIAVPVRRDARVRMLLAVSDPRSQEEPSFTVAEGRSRGLSRKQMRSRRYVPTFVGVRSATAPSTPMERARAYLAKMHPRAFFSHVTAAVIHGIWLPRHLEESLVLDVSVPTGQRAPRDAGVRGHTLVPRPRAVRLKDGLRVADAIETWCQLATVLGLEDLVVAGESLLAKGRAFRFTLDALALAVAVGGRPRQTSLERALSLMRTGSRSPMETRLRRLIIRAGLPEPAINTDVHDALGRWLAEVDLVYALQKIAIEYEGDQHFVNRRAARRDITRYERLQDAGWRVIRVTKDDYYLRPDETVARIRAALEART